MMFRFKSCFEKVAYQEQKCDCDYELPFDVLKSKKRQTDV